MKLYTPLTVKAMNTAYKAHRNKLDRYGLPYIYHLAHVAEQMDTEDEIVTALLHDAAEHTKTTFEDLEQEGFPQAVMDALHLLTYKPGHDYGVYIIYVSHNPLAAKVKLAAMRHNSDPARLALLPPEEAEKLRKRCLFNIQWIKEVAAEWTALFQNAEQGDPHAMIQAGIRYYNGDEYSLPRDRRKAFELISRAIEKGLPRERTDEDYPPYEYGELRAARYVVAMLLRDDDGIVSKRAEPFWFEKPWDEAADIEQIFMLVTGRGGVKRDLKKASKMAWHIFGCLSFSHDTNDNAEDIAKIIDSALHNDPMLYDWW